MGEGLLGVWMTVDVFHRLEIVFRRIPRRVRAGAKVTEVSTACIQVTKETENKTSMD